MYPENSFVMSIEVVKAGVDWLRICPNRKFAEWKFSPRVMLVSSRERVKIAREAAMQPVDKNGVSRLLTTNMYGADVSYYMDHVRGCCVRHGTLGTKQIGYPAHSSRFDIDKYALPIAAAYLASVAKTAVSRLV